MNSDFKVVRYHSLVVTNIEHTVLLPLANTNEGENIDFQTSNFFQYDGIQYSILRQHSTELWIEDSIELESNSKEKKGCNSE